MSVRPFNLQCDLIPVFLFFLFGWWSHDYYCVGIICDLSSTICFMNLGKPVLAVFILRTVISSGWLFLWSAEDWRFLSFLTRFGLKCVLNHVSWFSSRPFSFGRRYCGVETNCPVFSCSFCFCGGCIDLDLEYWLIYLIQAVFLLLGEGIYIAQARPGYMGTMWYFHL